MNRLIQSSRRAAPAAAALAAALLGGAAFAAPSVYPTGVTVYDPARAYSSYVIFTAPDDKTHLIDMDGNEVHRWDHPGFPGELLDPAVIHGERGHVLVQLSAIPNKTADSSTGVNPGTPAFFRNKTIGELDWDGKTVWEWGGQAPGGAARQHHDWYRLANGNTLVLANDYHSIPGFAAKNSLDDIIYEVTPKGEVVWKWLASDHLDEFGFTPASLALLRATPDPDYLHVNNMTALGPNRWFDAGDQRFNPENILIDSRNANFIAIIDKTSGKVVWRLGPDLPPSHDARQHPVPRPVDQISGQHDAHLIPPGLPGAGDLLVFDNQGEAGYPAVPLSVLPGSRVLEIDPRTSQIVWEYRGEQSDRPGWTFYSAFISSARRLPNGNTLIDEGMNGRFFQVTPAGEIVWEYVNPYFGHSPVGGPKDVYSNWVYRAQPVPYDWVPAGTPHAEKAVAVRDPAQYSLAGAP